MNDTSASGDLVERLERAITGNIKLTGIACKHGYDKAVCVMRECGNPYAIETILEDCRSEFARLAAAEARNSEPVAWQYRCKPDRAAEWSHWRPCEDMRDVEEIQKTKWLSTYRAEVRPLYAAPPDLQAKLVEAEARLGDLIKALRSLAEGNLGDAPWQANYATIKQIARNALPEEHRSLTDGAK